MKIAVCFSGQIRTGVHCVSNIKRFLEGVLPYCDFFMHTWDYETIRPYSRKIWNGKVLEPLIIGPVKEDTIQNMNSEYEFKKLQVENYQLLRNVNSIVALNPLYYSMARSFKMKEEYEKEQNITYDIVIKIRPDVVFPKFRQCIPEIANALKNSNSWFSDAYSEHRIDDVFWICSTMIADKLSTIPDYLTNKNTESITTTILKFAKENNIIHAPMCYNKKPYSIYRYESLMFDPLTQFKQICRNEQIYFGLEDESTLRHRFFLEDIQGYSYD